MYELRDYQQEAVDAGIECFNGKKNGIIVCPTGSGKSLILAFIAQSLGGRTVVFQPTKEILEQNLSKLHSFGYSNIGVYSASMGRKNIKDITLATIGSVYRKKYKFTDFDRIIVDECHLVNSKGGMYEKFINGLGLQTIGLTATPYRMRSYMEFNTNIPVAEARILTRTRPRIFNQIIHITQVKELFEREYLCPLEYTCYDDYNIKQIQSNSTGMGFNDKSLQNYNIQQSITDKIVNTVRGSSAQHCLAFTKFKYESKEVVEGLKKYNIRCVEVSGTTPRHIRESIITSFKMGAIKCVVNVGVLTTGFDFPELDCIIIGRPTKSVGLYYQMIGRGVRRAKGKESCKLIDLCGNVDTFGKIETFELVDPRKRNLWRLKSDRGYLTGVNLITGYDLEDTNVEIQTDPDSEIIIPFGKFKDMPISQVNTGYLKWCVENFEPDKWPEWIKIFTEELDRRRELIQA